MEQDRIKNILDEIEDALASDEYEIFPEGLTSDGRPRKKFVFFIPRIFL